MPGTNGYGANAFIDGVMRGYNFVDSIDERKRQRAQQDKDSAWQDEARGRQREDWNYQDQTRETPDQVQERRGLALDNLRTSNEAGKFGLTTAKDNQAYVEATRATPEEVRADRARQAESQNLGIASTRQAMGLRAKADARSDEQYNDEKTRRTLLSTIDFLDSPYASQFDDPEFRKATTTFDDFLNNGNHELRSGITAPALYDYGTKLFSRELEQGVGDKLKDGSTVENKRIVAARRDGDNFVLELAVTAKRPDGTTYEYNAPVTKNRTSEDTDEVLKIPVDSVRTRLRGAKYLAQAIDQGGGRQGALAELTRHYIDAGGDPKALRDPAKVGYREIKNGDKIDTYETRDGRISGKPIASGARFNPNGGLMFGMPGAAPAEAGPKQIGSTPDGRPVFEDAQGNRYTEE